MAIEVTTLLAVFDLPVSVRPYRDVLGFTMVSGSDDWWCLLKLGPATLMLNTAYDKGERPEKPEQSRVAGHVDTMLYFGVADPNSVYAHLLEKGWPAKAPALTSYGMRVVSTRDPDGFQLCFISPA